MSGETVVALVVAALVGLCWLFDRLRPTSAPTPPPTPAANRSKTEKAEEAIRREVEDAKQGAVLDVLDRAARDLRSDRESGG